MSGLERKLPRELILHQTPIPEPYGSLVNKFIKASVGRTATRLVMRNASHASSNDGATPRVYGWSVMNLMKKASGYWPSASRSSA